MPASRFCPKSVPWFVASVLLAISIASRPAAAQEVPSGDQSIYINYEDWALPEEEMAEEDAAAESWNFSATLGIGVGVGPDYEGSEDYNVGPRPAVSLRARRGRFSIATKGIGLQANMVLHPNVHAGLLARVRGGRGDVENDAVDRLEEIDTALELGGNLGFHYQGWLGGVAVTQDVAGAHEGLLVAGHAGYRAKPLPRLALTTAVNTTFASKGFMETYFGIDAENAARSGLSEFDADAGIKDVGLSVTLGYGFTKNWAMSFMAGYKRLLGDAADSPIVDDEGDPNQFYSGLSLIYRF